MKTKIIALYLPQYHEIEENNKWWGDGFTEWVNVKNAKKYTKMQNQPRIPLNNEYYDLSKKESILKQANLANEYGIDGFCIYHYYSKGKKLLETPAEIIVKNKEINISYFFSWANHDWRRVWASSNKEILRKQEYGDIDDIKNHFEYLLKFFKDERYIKIDNKPVFVIYQNIEEDIFCNIKDIWEKMSVESGFSGIYWIGTLSSKNSCFNIEMNEFFRFEPNYTRSILNFNIKSYQRIKQKLYGILNNRLIKYPYSFDYKYICNQINKTSNKDKKNLLGVFTGWDNTPRYKNKGYYYIKESPETFERCLESQYKLSLKQDKRFLFINAWNEWGEGAYLEPDSINEYAYLNAIKKVKYKNKFYK